MQDGMALTLESTSATAFGGGGNRSMFFVLRFVKETKKGLISGVLMVFPSPVSRVQIILLFYP
jgi:hypothetical protein